MYKMYKMYKHYKCELKVEQTIIRYNVTDIRTNAMW